MKTNKNLEDSQKLTQDSISLVRREMQIKALKHHLLLPTVKDQVYTICWERQWEADIPVYVDKTVRAILLQRIWPYLS